MKVVATTKSLLACLLLLGVSSYFAAAQSSQVAQISGLVEDSSGAAIVGAQVSMSNINTGLVRSAVTGGNGSYSITTLPIGSYRLEASKQGFDKYIQNGIVLDVNTNPSIVISLKVGSVTEEVTVIQNTAQVETHDAGVGTLVDQQHVVDLPLNGRNVTQLVALSGASVTAPPPSGQAIISNKNYPSASAFSIAGGQAGQTLFVLDGAYNLDPSSNVGLPYPFPDALQEFKVETSSLPANYGSQPGGFVNVVTKSGTNHLHGGAFEFYRNFNMDGSNYFSQLRDSLNRNQFGGEVGGPIMKDKLFFFGGYQGTYENAPLAPATFFLPTPASLGQTTPGVADFTALAGPACNNGTQLTLKAPFVNNMVPSTSLNQIAVAFATQFLPIAQVNSCGKIVYTVPSTDHENQEVGRVDYTLSQRQNLDARYFITNYQHPPLLNGNLLNLQTDAAVGLHDQVQSLVLGHTFAINAKAVSSFRVAAARNDAVRYSPSGEPTATQLGSAVYQANPAYIYFSVSGDFTAACTNCSPSYFASNISQIGEDFTLIRGKHEIIFGGDWIHVHFNGHSSFQSNGDFSFGNTFTGLAMSDFELGDLSSFGQSTGAVLHEGVNVPSLYVQDNFKPSKNLSLNVGLRWDPYNLPVNYDHHESIFDPSLFNANVHSTVFPNAPVGTLFYGDAGMPPNGGYGFGQKAALDPRVGIVFDPRGEGKETIRAGYGIFYGSIPLYLVVGTHAPFANPVTISSPAGGLSNPWQGYPGGNPFPLPSQFPASTVFPSFGGGLGNYFLHNKPTSIQQWSLSFQKQAPWNWLLSATYLGNKTDHLEYNQNVDPVTYIPGTCTAGQYGLTKAGNCSQTSNYNQRSLFYMENPSQGQYIAAATSVYNFGAVATYNGLLLSAIHSFSKNFSILSNYTWSHCLGESDIGLNGGNAPENPFNLRGDYGNCGADERHIFNLAVTAITPKVENHLVNALIERWQIAPIYTVHSGQYFTVTDGTSNSLLDVTDRPNLIGNTSVGKRTIGQWFNNIPQGQPGSAFAFAGPGNYGNLGRNTIRGPGAWNLDMALSRGFDIHREQILTMRVEAFNLTNTTHLANPGGSLSSLSTFGIVTATAPGAAGNPRILQLAAKFAF